MKKFTHQFRFILPLLFLNLLLGVVTFSFLSTPTPALAEACWHTIGEWESMTDIPVARVEGMSIVADGKIYVVGGFYDNSWHASNRLDIYDPATDTWSQGANYPILITHAGIALDGDDIWVVGGFNDYPVTDDVYIYSIANDEWRAGPDLPDPIGSASLIRIGRYLHYFGGVEADRQTDRDEHLILDLDNPTGWTLHTSINRPRNHMSPVYIDGLVYSLGGMLGHNGGLELDVDYVDVYNPNTNTWSAHGALNFPRSHFEPGTIVSNGRVIMVGGRNNTAGQTRITNLTEYNPATDESYELRAVPERIIGGVGQIVGDKIIVSAGQTWGRDTWQADISFDCDNDSASVNIEKTNQTGAVASGENVTFEIIVSNTGTGTLTNIVVDDPLTPDCDASFGTIAENESETYTCVASNVQQGFTNVATVTAQSDDGELVDEDSASVALLSPSISLSMNANSPIYAGQGAQFSLSVHNNGDLPLSNVAVDANHAECDETIGNLAVDATHNYSCTIFNATQNVTVNADASGQYNNQTVNDDESETVVVQTPSVMIDVSPDTQTIDYEGTANFDVEVTNTGEVDLTEVNIDVVGALDCYRDLTDFSPEETQSYSCSLDNMTESISLTFSAVGIYAPGTVPVEAEETVSITVNPPPLPIKPVGLNAIADFQIAPVNPVFEWEHGVSTTWYRLLINDSNGTLLDAWYEVGTTIVCDEDCSINPNLNLSTNGAYSWWVMGWNPQGNGEWSDEANFNVAIPMPAQPTGLTTLGDLTSAPVIPEFQWAHDEHSDWYNIYITGANGVILDQWYDVNGADISCDESVCTVSPNIDFSNGNYSWWVMGWNPQGNGEWSDVANFTVDLPAPATPTGLTTNGDLTAIATPTFSWDNDSVSIWYEVYISGANGLILDQWYDVNGVDIVCTPNICTVSPNIGFTAGTYSWWVRGWNAQGMGIWSDTATFIVAQGNVVPTGLTTVGDLSDVPATPTFQFDRINGSTWYELYISDANGVVHNEWYEVGGAGMVCDDNICTISPNLALPAGDYSWWVRGWNAQQGNLPWNDPAATFSVGE